MKFVAFIVNEQKIVCITGLQCWRAVGGSYATDFASCFCQSALSWRYKMRKWDQTFAASSETAPRFPKSLLTISLSKSTLPESEILFLCQSGSYKINPIQLHVVFSKHDVSSLQLFIKALRPHCFINRIIKYSQVGQNTSIYSVISNGFTALKINQH